MGYGGGGGGKSGGQPPGASGKPNAGQPPTPGILPPASPTQIFSPQFGMISSDDPRAPAADTQGTFNLADYYGKGAATSQDMGSVMNAPQAPDWQNMDEGDLVRQYRELSNADPQYAAARAAVEDRGGGGDTEQARNENAGRLINQYSAGGSDFNFGASSNANTASMLNDQSPAMVKWRAANPQWVAAAQKAISG